VFVRGPFKKNVYLHCNLLGKTHGKKSRSLALGARILEKRGSSQGACTTVSLKINGSRQEDSSPFPRASLLRLCREALLKSEGKERRGGAQLKPFLLMVTTGVCSWKFTARLVKKAASGTGRVTRNRIRSSRKGARIPTRRIRGSGVCRLR